MHRVVILQEYVPEYRVAFFETLHELAKSEGIELIVASGVPRGAQRLRGDAATVGFHVPLRQREFRIMKKRLVFRRIGKAVASADLVILEQARRNVDAYRLLLPRHTRRLIALWGHGKDYTQPTSRLNRALHRMLTLRADWFFAYTKGGIAAVTEVGYPMARTTAVQNSIDTAALRSGISDVTCHSIASFSDDLDLRGKTALFMGALDDSKRLDFLCEAAELSHALNSDFRLLIGGDGALREDMQRRASIHSWLTYLGPIREREKAVALATAQVIAMPGRVGLVAVDSFASGVPIITTAWAQR
jgi:glycosyltransferase involved in cell wall biosynthesis